MPREPKKQEVEEEKNIENTEEIVEEKPAPAAEKVPQFSWKAKTFLGKKVLAGEVTDIAKIFSEGIKISEPYIIDALLPNIEKEIILIGGSTGKGGGIRRTPFKRTSRMHKSGRRYRISVMSVVGNKDGYVGLGMASGPPGKHQEVIEKSTNKAKLNLIPVRRGCGSWECSCGTNHSIPFKVQGKSGSVVIKMMPAPKGIGLCVSDEVKKMLRLAGISDVWCKTRGNTQMRANLMFAAFNALKKLNSFKTKSEFEKRVCMTTGKA